MKNTLGDLNLHLFEQLERLNDEELKGQDLNEEMNRAKAISSISSQIIQNASLVLKASTVMQDRVDADAKLPKMLEG